MVGTVFIHTNRKQLVAAKVAAHAVRVQSPSVDVELIELDEAPALTRRHGDVYLRQGVRSVWRNDELQSFTPLRFRPPELLGFSGRALVIDPDVFAVADVRPLLERDLGGAAIACRRIDQTPERDAYWATSVMLLDCSKLQHWRWTEMIDRMFNLELDYRGLMTLAYEDPSTIVPLEEEWNQFDMILPSTKLLHNTSRLTQPWKTGLPIDFTTDRPRPRRPRGVGRAKALAKRAFGRVESSEQGVYRAHPDPTQEHLFFRLLADAIDAGTIDEGAVAAAVRDRDLRQDSLELLAEARASAR